MEKGARPFFLLLETEFLILEIEEALSSFSEILLLKEGAPSGASGRVPEEAGYF